jgi:glycosyltransferase involved in cell wall biosynthesis|tara:strand:+ start:87 stop:884 length:798 start_codon:yes stop_codon:yes gene_type:complete
MSTNPAVSIVIPLYNCEDTIRRSLMSIKNQTFRDFETIVVDNNCTDSTIEIIENEFLDVPGLKILKCSKPGIVPALNTGLRSAVGDWIARQDGDDYWLPEKLEKQMSYLKENTDVHVLGTQINLLDENGKPQDVGTFGVPVTYPEENNEIKGMMMYGQNPICHPSVIFSRALLDVLGGYEQIFPLAEDLHLWIRAFPHFTFANLPDKLIDYTQKKSDDYDARVPLLLADTYYELYKKTSIITGDREERVYDWQWKKDGHLHHGEK